MYVIVVQLNIDSIINNLNPPDWRLMQIIYLIILTPFCGVIMVIGVISTIKKMVKEYHNLKHKTNN
jgi:phosphate/sulfate permease